MTGAAAGPDVVVVGAGLAGLTCAQDLTRAGIECRVLEASDGVGVIVADLDLARLAAIRSTLPSLANRRPGAYRWPV